VKARSEVSVRKLSPRDAPDVGSLQEESPDTGAVGFSLHFEIHPLVAYQFFQGGFIGFGAESGQKLVGACLIRFGRCQFEGDVRPFALLNTLVVHPDYRRRGIATALFGKAVEFARARVGQGGVIWASIQQGNTGSERTARKYQRQFLGGRIVVVPMKTRSRAPRLPAGIAVREIREDEFGEVANHLNAFYRGYNLYEPFTADMLREWCAGSPFPTPARRYFLAADSRGRLLAGVGMTETYRLRTLHIVRMPQILQALNAAMRIVPPDGIIRELGLSKLWFSSGNLRVAKCLLELVRFRWHRKATVVMGWADTRSPLYGLFGVRPWTPLTRLGLVLVESPLPLGADRLIYYE